MSKKIRNAVASLSKQREINSDQENDPKKHKTKNINDNFLEGINKINNILYLLCIN
jgi:hypothetical protein